MRRVVGRGPAWDGGIGVRSLIGAQLQRRALGLGSGQTGTLAGQLRAVYADVDLTTVPDLSNVLVRHRLGERPTVVEYIEVANSGASVFATIRPVAKHLWTHTTCRVAVSLNGTQAGTVLKLRVGGQTSRLGSSVAPHTSFSSPASVIAQGAGFVVINAMNFGLDGNAIQAAIDALPKTGGWVYVPALPGGWTCPNTIYTPCDRPCHLFGDGAALDITVGPVYGTILNFTTNSATTHNDYIRLRGSYSTISFLHIRGTGVASSNVEANRGIVVGTLNRVDPHPASGLNPANTENQNSSIGDGVGRHQQIHDCVIEDTGSYGIYWLGMDSTNAGTTVGNSSLGIFGRNNDNQIYQSRAFGAVYVGQGCTTVRFKNVAVGGFKGYGVRFYSCEQCVWEDDCTIEEPVDNVQPWLSIINSVSITVREAWFESHTGGNLQYFIQVDGVCTNITVDGGRYVRGNAAAEAGLLRVYNETHAGTTGTVLRNLRATSAANVLSAGVPIDTQAIKFASGFSAYLLGDNVVIGPDTAGPCNLRVSGLSPASFMVSQLRVRLPGGVTADRESQLLAQGTVERNQSLYFDRDQGGPFFFFDDRWRPFGIQIDVMSTATRTSPGTQHKVRDVILDTGDNYVYICTVAGTGATATFRRIPTTT